MKINYENEKIVSYILEHCGRRTGLNIIVTRCCACLELIGVKLGHGVNGISDSYCPSCAAIIKSKKGNSAIWPLIGCLLAGSLLAWEYVYSILKYLE